MNIDPRRLTLWKIESWEDFVVDKTFYLKQSDGSYNRCVITQEDLDSPHGAQYMWLTLQYASEKRIFLNINAPGRTFVR
jgi:hypothetical protein